MPLGDLVTELAGANPAASLRSSSANRLASRPDERHESWCATPLAARGETPAWHREELGPNGRRLASRAATRFVHDELGRADKAAVCVVGRALQTLTDLTSDKGVIGRWELES
jgi:hypothetical protein